MNNDSVERHERLNEPRPATIGMMILEACMFVIAIAMVAATIILLGA